MCSIAVGSLGRGTLSLFFFLRASRHSSIEAGMVGTTLRSTAARLTRMGWEGAMVDACV